MTVSNSARWPGPGGVGKFQVGYITDAPAPPDIPCPVGYRMVVQIFEIRDKTESGLVIAQQTKDAERTLAMMGRVIAQGPDCYSDHGKFPNGPWCSEGDVVMLAKYTGHKFAVRGVPVITCNDDEVLAVVSEPNAITRA